MTESQLQSELRFRERMATSADLAAVLIEEDAREAAIIADATQTKDDTQTELEY